MTSAFLAWATRRWMFLSAEMGNAVDRVGWGEESRFRGRDQELFRDIALFEMTLYVQIMSVAAEYMNLQFGKGVWAGDRNLGVGV